MNPSEITIQATPPQQDTNVRPLPTTVVVTDGEWSSVDFELSIEWERTKYLRAYVAGNYLFFYLGDKPEFVEKFTISTEKNVSVISYTQPAPAIVVDQIAFAGKTLITMHCDESTSKRTFTLASNVRYIRTNK